MPRKLRILSSLLLASSACATGNSVENTGGAGGQGTPASSGSGASGMTSSASSASASSSGAGGAPASSSAASSSAASSSAASSSSSGGGGAVAFTVVRVGDGAAALSASATPVFLEQRMLDGTLVGNALALPTAVSGNNQPLTLSGNAGSEGGLSLSGNGSYLTLGGYAAIDGTPSVALTTTATVNRVIGRIDANGNINTTTRLNTAFDTGNIRAVATQDGTAFWASGVGPGQTGGVQYIALGAVGGTQILNAPNNARWAHVFAGQLYASSGSGVYVNVFTVGAGLPTASGQVATTLPGLPVIAASPYSFALLDRDPVVPGVDTLYLSDDQSQALGGGVQKWTFNGASWTKVATFVQGIMTGVRGIAAVVTGNDVTVIATTSGPSQNNVVVYVDNGAMNPMGTIVATAGLNTAFRGVAISPK
jgi:hypothetical protein